MRLILILVFLTFIVPSHSQVNRGKLSYSDLDSTRKSKLDSILFSKIPYNSKAAIEDIKLGNIRLISLNLLGHPVNTNDEYRQIEKRFGFKFHYDYFETAGFHVSFKQKEYNNVIYSYLDSIYNTDVKLEIKIELCRLFFERKIASIETDKK